MENLKPLNVQGSLNIALLYCRCLKKEDHSSLKQLINCNLVLIDRDIQRALKPMNLYKEDKVKEEAKFLEKPTVADMLDMFLNVSSTTSQSTSPGLEATTFSTSSSSSPKMYVEEFHQTGISKPDIFSPLGEHRVELKATYRALNRYSKSQPLSQTVLRELEVPTKSKSGILEEKSGLSKSRSGKEFPLHASFFCMTLYILPKYVYISQ